MNLQVDLRPASFGTQMPDALTEPDADVSCRASQRGCILSAQLQRIVRRSGLYIRKPGL